MTDPSVCASGLIVIDPVYVWAALAVCAAVALLRSVPVRCDRCHKIVRSWVVIRNEKRKHSVTVCDACLRSRAPRMSMEPKA